MEHKSLRELSQDFGIPYETLRSAVREHRLKHEKVGRFYFVRKADLLRAISEGKLRGAKKEKEVSE